MISNESVPLLIVSDNGAGQLDDQRRDIIPAPENKNNVSVEKLLSLLMRELISYLDMSRISLRHWPVIESTPSTLVQVGVLLQCNGEMVKPSLAKFTYSTG